MAIKTPLYGLRNPFKFGLRGVGPSLPITPVLSDFGAGSIDDLELDPPAIFIEHNTSGTLTGDFDTSATPPAKEAGDIGFFTTSLSGDAVTDISTALNAFFALHPAETGYMHFRLTNGAGDSNVITTQVISVPGFDPATLFALSESGAWYDPSDLSTLWQDTARTVAVASDSDPVRVIDDKSGNGYNLVAPSDAARPLYKTAGGLHWLEFDGTDDSMSIAWTMGAQVTHVGGWRVTTAANGLYALGANFGTRTRFVTGPGLNFGAAVGGGTSYVAGDDMVIRAFINTANSAQNSITRNGNVTGSTFAALSNTTLDRLSIMTDRFSPNSWTSGRFFGGVWIERALTSQEITNMEAWAATKAGVTL